MADKNIMSGYLDLLKKIKTKDEDNYEPKDYNFSLDNFDENGNIKKNKRD